MYLVTSAVPELRAEPGDVLTIDLDAEEPILLTRAAALRRELIAPLVAVLARDGALTPAFSPSLSLPTSGASASSSRRPPRSPRVLAFPSPRG